MDALRPAIELVLPPPCFKTVIQDGDLFNVVCLKIALSKSLGYGIILGSVLVKLPQILKLWSAKSGQGINILSVLLELLGITSSTAYGYANKFPISAYGEGLFLLVQTLAIAFLILLYGKETRKAVALLGCYGAACAYLFSPVASPDLIWALQAANMPVVALSKMIQALENFKNGSTGQLSALTVSLLFAGSLARIFTSVQETNDSTMILTYIVASLCNGIIFMQVLFYWNSSSPASKGSQSSAQPVKLSKKKHH